MTFHIFFLGNRVVCVIIFPQWDSVSELPRESTIYQGHVPSSTPDLTANWVKPHNGLQKKPQRALFGHDSRSSTWSRPFHSVIWRVHWHSVKKKFSWYLVRTGEVFSILMNSRFLLLYPTVIEENGETTLLAQSWADEQRLREQTVP